MITAKVTLNRQLRDLPKQISPASIASGLVVAGRGLRNFLISYFREKNAVEPNKLGGKRTNYWSDVGRSVTQPKPAAGAAVTVDITQPTFWHKVHGGEIRPKVKKWLALPANALAYGKPPISFNLVFAFARDPERGNRWRRALILAAAMKRKQDWVSQRRGASGVHAIRQSFKLAAGDVMYWLCKKVTQKPAPGALPSQAELERSAGQAFDAWLKIILAPKAGTA